jgi:hypothetical protein
VFDSHRGQAFFSFFHLSYFVKIDQNVGRSTPGENYCRWDSSEGMKDFLCVYSSSGCPRALKILTVLELEKKIPGLKSPWKSVEVLELISLFATNIIDFWLKGYGNKN